MLALITWTTQGTWLAGPARGLTEPGGDEHVVPEPDRDATAKRAGSLKWPAVRLDETHHATILADLPRIAELREFTVHVAVLAPDHVHLLIGCGGDRDMPRLVQLIKGALSRALSVAGGDTPARSTTHETLPHRKWWSRQHSVVMVPEGVEATRDRIVRRLREHEQDPGVTVASFNA